MFLFSKNKSKLSFITRKRLYKTLNYTLNERLKLQPQLYFNQKKLFRYRRIQQSRILRAKRLSIKRVQRKRQVPFFRKKRFFFIRRLKNSFSAKKRKIKIGKKKRLLIEKRKMSINFLNQVLFRYQIRQTRNNMFTTFLTKKGAVLFSLSCGAIGLTGPRRSTPFAAEQLGRISGLKLRRIAKLKNTFIILKSALNRHVRGCISSTAIHFHYFKGMIDLIPRPHNGLRARKLRRL